MRVKEEIDCTIALLRLDDGSIIVVTLVSGFF